MVSALSLRESDSPHSARVWTDEVLLSASGVVVGFSERGGGVSQAPFDSLNLGSHVGDDPVAVDQNRRRMLDALGLDAFREQLTMAEQVHGERIALVRAADAGSGAFAGGGRLAFAGTDVLITREAGVPLALCFADCVPIILVAPGPAVAVVHAGWRGALSSLPGKAALELARVARCEPSTVTVCRFMCKGEG